MKTAVQPSPTTLLTADDLFQLDDEVRGELIRGVFCEMTPPGHEHGRVVALLTHALVAHVEERQLGVVVAGDSGVHLEHDPDTVRAPDVAFTSGERLPMGRAIHGYAQVVPDLVVEVVSPSDRHADVRDKARMWLSFGVQLVWVVFPAARTGEVYRAGTEAVETLTEADSLDGGDVLPGFTYPLSQLFAD
ncbi:MAG: Uma2 family endonuclease [Acidimicrobiaceae bacterium]|nr:Uma2 family endonuclease [Acidimicrobiaceae bacterium]